MPTIKFNGEAEWLALRDIHIGGSEVAALFNLWRRPDGQEVVRHLYEGAGADDICLGSLSPYTNGYRLFMEKSGKVAAEDLSSVGRIQAGQYLEPAIAQWAMRRWPDWKLRKSRVYHRHIEVEGWGASLDYWVQQTGRPPVDIKNVDAHVFRREWTLDPDNGEVANFPLHIALQLQHQIGCTGADASWVLACVGGNELYRGLIPRHEATQARIRQAVAAFWIGVAEGLEPMEASFGDVKEVFAFGGSDKADFADLRDDPEASRIARRLRRWQAHEKFVKQQTDQLKGAVGRYIGEHYGANFEGVRAVWPLIRRDAKSYTVNLPAKDYRGGLTLSEPK